MTCANLKPSPLTNTPVETRAGFYWAQTPTNSTAPLEESDTDAECAWGGGRAWFTAQVQHTAAHCSTLQHTAAHCNTLQHTAAHCSTLQHTAAHCSTLQHICLTRLINKAHDTQMSLRHATGRSHVMQASLHVACLMSRSVSCSMSRVIVCLMSHVTMTSSTLHVACDARVIVCLKDTRMSCDARVSVCIVIHDCCMSQ